VFCLRGGAEKTGNRIAAQKLKLDFGQTPCHQCRRMKTYTSKLVLLGSLLALTCVFAAPTLRAAPATPATPATPAAPAAPAKEHQVSKKMLEKYDTNHDGKLDATEKAAMEADMAKAKGKHKGANKGEGHGQEK
jgi:hypothetical protein